MNDGHSSDMSHGAMKCEVHSSVRVDVLCVEVSLGGHVVIGVGIVHRHHASIIFQ